MKKVIRIFLKTIISILVASVAIVVVYVGYVMVQYSRIKDNQQLSIDVKSQETLSLNKDKTFSVSTYNIGFGAYRPEFDFFMDTGYLADGTPTKGHSSRAISKASVIEATEGVISTLKDKNIDFMLYQEVDTSSDRSHHVNQHTMLSEAYENYDAVHASNFHSAYLFYPITNPHGKSNSGITTLSKYKVDESVRRSFPVTSAFPAKFFDLDRCFSVSRYNIDSDTQLVLINLHMSAYDKGGTIRAKQIKMIKEVFTEEYSKGNYIVMGGDFNHDLLKNNPEFQYENEEDKPSWMGFTQLKPDWLQFIDFDNDLTANMKVGTDDTTSTCRGSDMPWIGNEDIIYTAVIDGFIVSDNIDIVNVTNIDNNYLYSDHQPVVMEFKFK